MQNSEEIVKKENIIRHHFDENSNEFYYSIVDVIDNLGLSTDPRNYWKVLKNRLKKGENKLVTECNQLKMPASDGKCYLTDVTNASTTLQIVQLVSPEKVTAFEEFFNKVERENSDNDTTDFSEEKKISTVFFDEGEIQIDMYKKENNIFVRAMLAGVEPEDIFISTNCKNLTIKVNRIRTSASLQVGNNIDETNYHCQELYWGKFSREVELPFEIDIDRVETNFNYGLITIKLFISDKTRTKIVKVK